MKHLWIIPAAIVLLAGCKKDEAPTPVTPTTPVTYTVRGQLQAYVPALQIFTLDATNGGTITGAKGGTFTFPPNAFRTLSNQTVSGNVTIQLKEIYSPLDMALSGVYPMSTTGPLYSGGEYYIEALQGSQQLKLAPWTTFSAAIPATNPDPGMQMFLGEEVNDTVTWVPADSSSACWTDLSHYNIQCDSLHWGNCDQWPSGQQTWTSMNIHANCATALTNVSSFVYYDGHNSLFSIWGDPFSTNGMNNYECWENQAVHVIIIGVDASGNLYSGMIGTTVSLAGTYTVNMTQTTGTAIAAQMNALP